MKNLYLGLLAAAAMAVTALVLGFAASPASAHRSWCHSHHTCPSDHATYRWRGLLCVAPYADERNSTFRRRAVYAGRVYWCKR
jgi:hypothetical protein